MSRRKVTKRVPVDSGASPQYDRPMTGEEILRLSAVKATKSLSSTKETDQDFDVIGYVESASKPEIRVEAEELPVGQGIAKKTWKLGVSLPPGNIQKGLPGLNGANLSVQEVRQSFANSGSKTLETELATQSYRPPWLDLQPVPRIVPLPARPPRRVRRPRSDQPLRGGMPELLEFSKCNPNHPQTQSATKAFDLPIVKAVVLQSIAFRLNRHRGWATSSQFRGLPCVHPR
jgi:hypothetical protein